MDGRQPKADARLVKLGEAIKDALGNQSQASLASSIGVQPARLSRILSGQVEDVSINFVVAVEDALRLGRGDLLRAAGYVDDAVTLSAAAASDPNLSPEQRRVVRNLIGSWRG